MVFHSEHGLQTMGVFHVSLLNLQEDTIPQAVAHFGVFPPADRCHCLFSSLRTPWHGLFFSLGWSCLRMDQSSMCEQKGTGVNYVNS